MQRSGLPSCLLTSEGSDVVMKWAGALIWFLWNFMLPVFRNRLKHSAAGTVEIGVLLPLPRRITSQFQVRDGAAIAARSLGLS